MATGEELVEDLSALNDEARRRGELAHRRDLDTIFGFAITEPPGGMDLDGNWWYVLPGELGSYPDNVVDKYVGDIQAIIQSASMALVEKGLMSSDQIVELPHHPYEIGPASGSFGALFFEIIQDPERVLSNLANLYAIGQLLSFTLKRIGNWAKNLIEEFPGLDQVSLTIDQLDLVRRVGIRSSDEFAPILTRPAIAALCYCHVVDSYEIAGEVSIDTFSRGWIYGGVEHPEGRERHLTRIRTGNRWFYYFTDGGGLALDHYLLSGDDLTPLALPDFGHPHHDDYWRMEPVQSLRVK